jgi:hypothetical protein
LYAVEFENKVVYAMDYKINGPKYIKSIIRPPRIAFVISSLNDAEKFISIASLSWGGRHFLAIPYTNEGGISDEWFDVLKKYNPDDIRTFCELSSEIVERLWRSRFVVNKIAEYTKIEIRGLSDSSDNKRIPEFFGQPIINFFFLDKFFDDLDSQSKDKPRLSYIPLKSAFDLYYKARYGVIDQNEWMRWQHVYVHHAYRKESPDQLIENAPFSLEQDILSYLYENRNKHHSNSEYISLIDYTTIRLGYVSIQRMWETLPKSETNQVVIISKAENIDDFCWYWAIRGQRYHSPHDDRNIEPIWLSLEQFTTKYSLVQDLFRHGENVHLISKSISKDNLPLLDDNWIFQQDNLHEFYNKHYYIGDTQDISVNFIDNEAEYKLEIPEALKFLGSSNDRTIFQYAIADIQIPGITLPRISGFFRGKVFLNNYNITKSGLADHILSATKDRISNIGIPSPWNIISVFSNSAGYSLEISDKGRITNELIRLMEKEENVWVISHPAIIDLLLEMSNTNKVLQLKHKLKESDINNEIRNEIIKSFPRKSLYNKNLSYSKIRTLLKDYGDKKLDENSNKIIIKWLLDKSIIRQGSTIKCNLCFTQNWIPVAKFDSTIICTGCMSEIKNPFGIDKVDWEYEINALVSAQIDQGVLIHLLTGFYFIDKLSLDYPKKSIYGSYYGLKFKDKSGKDKKEIDIGFMIDGELIIGECKVSGLELPEKEILGYIDFAREIQASKVVFSCLEDVEEILKVTDNIHAGDIEIIVLSKADLLYQYHGAANDRRFREERPEKSPIDKLAQYRERLESLNNPDWQ